MYGELDIRSPLHVGEAIRSEIPNAELAVIQGVGHMANVEAPIEFNGHVRRFLRAIAQS